MNMLGNKQDGLRYNTATILLQYCYSTAARYQTVPQYKPNRKLENAQIVGACIKWVSLKGNVRGPSDYCLIHN